MASSFPTEHANVKIDEQSVMLYQKVVELCNSDGSDDDIEDVLALAFNDENVRQYVPRDPISGDLMSPRSFRSAVQSHVAVSSSCPSSGVDEGSSQKSPYIAL
eukprot:gnl/MRDRNA2_/MRDRNA2_93639_c0_seq1.p1 gnl/MRDRNA2_/MRDRNA2_93639_c0~~gnl/MRDRNA2_/MRDRNA2_93639_c0_seq1.p1  ORF type:complete len:103 (+),score=19.44 gnl/MRDRNA2_/MRDRNA2_93639_c0_seq1:71-379(+)